MGESRTRRADVRVLAASNRNSKDDVKAGRFREDLLFRLNVIQMHVPPLRQRPEDILRLAQRFLLFFARHAGRVVPQLSDCQTGAARLCMAMERAVILWPAQRMEPEAFPEAIATHTEGQPVLGGPFTLEAIERTHLLRVLQHTSVQEEEARACAARGHARHLGVLFKIIC